MREVRTLKEKFNCPNQLERYVLGMISKNLKTYKHDEISSAVSNSIKFVNSKINELHEESVRIKESKNAYDVQGFYNDLMAFSEIKEILEYIEGITNINMSQVLKFEDLEDLRNHLAIILMISNDCDVENPSWIQTDDYQWVKQLAVNQFNVINITSCPDGEYTISQTLVDIGQYFIEEFEKEIKPFGYESIGQVFSEYGLDANQIIAECLSENWAVESIEFRFRSEEEALDHIEKLIIS